MAYWNNITAKKNEHTLSFPFFTETKDLKKYEA
jgi:hypothetical protein